MLSARNKLSYFWDTLYEAEVTKISCNREGLVELKFTNPVVAILFSNELLILNQEFKKKNIAPFAPIEALQNLQLGDKSDDNESLKVVTLNKDQYIVLQTYLKDKLKTYDEISACAELSPILQAGYSPATPMQPSHALPVKPSSTPILEEKKRIKNKESKFYLLSGLSKTKLESKWVGINIKYPNSFVLNYLSREDLLSYRSASKATLEETKKMVGPYENLFYFVLATSGSFYNRNKISFSKIQCLNGWYVYSKTIQNRQYGPSVLYKIRNRKISLEEFAGKEGVCEIIRNGRVYTPNKSPGKHDMQVNTAWLLAQFHAGRRFKVTSDIHPANLRRQDFPEQYSAFSREVAALYMAGYQITGQDHKGCLILSPIKKTQQELNQLTIRSIKASDAKIEEAFTFYSKQQKLRKIYYLVKDIKEALMTLDSDDFQIRALYKLKRDHAKQSEKSLAMLEDKQHQIFACEQFILFFNLPPHVGPKIKFPVMAGIFDNSKLFAHIKEHIIKLFATKIYAAIMKKLSTKQNLEFEEKAERGAYDSDSDKSPLVECSEEDEVPVEELERQPDSGDDEIQVQSQKTTRKPF